MGVKFDFGGYATRNDLLCSDGRTIRRDAFKDNDGKVVPLVWNHDHNNPTNVLGHALLENRPDGVYAYCSFNDTENGQTAKKFVKHKDVVALSIYANRLKQDSQRNILHGAIREVSLVLAGANPGATIDSYVLEHGEYSEYEAVICNVPDLQHGDDGSIDYDGFEDYENNVDYMEEDEDMDYEDENPVYDEELDEEDYDEDILYDENGDPIEIEDLLYDENGDPIFDEDADPDEIADAIYDAVYDEAFEQAMAHSDDGEEYDDEETVADVFDTLTEKQKNVVYALIGQAIEDAGDEEGDENMRHSVWDNEYDEYDEGEILSHAEMDEIFADAKNYGSLKDAVLQHGIEQIDWLFPEAKSLNTPPDWVKREDGWVTTVMGAVHRTPFSRIKSMFADIREADARARGYIKGNYKVEEVFTLLKRTTDPQTVYKKQKLDRDDVVDITDFDVVSWIKTEMRGMLNEELARAILVGDGRNPSSDDKIKEDHIRPIWTDNEFYTINKTLTFSSSMTDDAKAKAFIRAAVKARVDYKGSGSPTLFTTENILTDCLLIEDGIGHRLYKSESELATALRVKNIVTVPVMENLSRTVGSATRDLMGIIVNLSDYNIGADKGGAISMFDDFDIDYNAQKYLIETRCSGALIRPYSAIAIESVTGANLDVDPEDATETVLGKLVSDLQSNVLVDGDYIEGTLKYVTGYTGYSGKTEEQSGNYLALKIDAPSGATTTAEMITNGAVTRTVTLDSDMNIVIRVTNKRAQKIRFTTTSSGATVVKTFSLVGLKLLSA